MRPKRLLNNALLLSAGVFIGTSAFAQNPQHRAHEARPQSSFLAPMIEQLKQSNFHFYQPLHNQRALQQKPTATKSRLKAIATASYDGVFFIPQDSTRVYWNGTRVGNGDELVGFLISIMGYAPSQVSSAFFNPKQELLPLLDADSLSGYHWDDGPGLYEENRKMIVSFDASGNVTSSVEKTYNGTSWENDQRTVYTYDAQGNRTSEVEQDWTGTVWENEHKQAYDYDANNNLTGYESSVWDIVTSDWKFPSKSVYEYDGQGNFVRETYQYTFGGVLTNGSRYSYAYTNGKRVSMIEEEWDGVTSQWENDFKEEYAYDANDQLKTVLTWDWDGSAWEEDEKYLFAYDGAGNNSSIILQWWDGSSWEYDRKASYAYSGNNLTEIVVEFWDNGSSSFEKDARIAYTFNDYDQCTGLIVQDKWDGTEWSSTSGAPKFSFYYEEFDDGEAGINTTLDKDAFLLYPSPAQHQITVKMNEHTLNHIRITDISGKVVFSSQASLNTSEVTLPVGHLADGLYVLQLQSGNQQGTRTFVVKH